MVVLLFGLVGPLDLVLSFASFWCWPCFAIVSQSSVLSPQSSLLGPGALFLAARSSAAARSAVVFHTRLLRVPVLSLPGRICPANGILPLLNHRSPPLREHVYWEGQQGPPRYSTLATRPSVRSGKNRAPSEPDRRPQLPPAAYPLDGGPTGMRPQIGHAADTALTSNGLH